MTGGEKIPSGTQGTDAEMLALLMKKTINKTAWDTTHYVRWTFRDKHHYLWDKKRHMAQVQWDDKTVLLDINKQNGLAFQSGQPIGDSIKSQQLIRTAYEYFINDAFWLNAPAMAFNDDVRKEYIDIDDAHKGLLVTYLSGGVTPGDAYLWKLDKWGRPVSFKMWVKIIPRGGVEASWEDWTQLHSGAWIAQTHRTKMGTIRISNLQDSQHFLSFAKEDPFAALSQKKKI